MLKMRGIFGKISLVFCLVLLLSLASAALAAEDDIAASGQCGDNLTWTLTEDGTLTIRGSGDMWDFDPNGIFSPTWEGFGEKIRSVVIESGVTGVGDCAFRNYQSIRSITISEGVKRIGKSAFENCHLVKELTIPDSVDSIEDGAFLYCRGLTSVWLGTGLTRIGKQAFSYCMSLEGITLPEGLIELGDSAFSFCYADSFETVTIPASVRSIGAGVFAYTEIRQILVEPDNPIYKDRNGVVYDKAETELVAYPVGREGYADPIPETTVFIGNSAFCGGISVTGVTIPDSVVRIGDHAFADCRAMSEILIPRSVESIGSAAFSGPGGLQSITVEQDNPRFCDIDGVLYDKDRTVLIAYPRARAGNAYAIPDTVVWIEKEAFVYAVNLNSIRIPVSVTRIGAYAFVNCSVRFVYYDGDEAQWNAVSIGEGNEFFFMDAAICFGSALRGDVDGNGTETSDDAIFLLRHTLSPERYPINQSGDVNGDGLVTSDDAIYLLRHVLLPAQYPLI